jgi:SulP family sulfate permease
MRIRSIDLISGGLASVIILTSTLSYVAFIFSGQLSGTLHYAVGFGLVSAGVMAVVFALGSNVPFVVAGPDSKPTAVLAIMATVVVAGMGMGRPSPNTGLLVLAALVLGTVATGAAMYLLGAFRMGQWVRFIPYPVIGGFMAASGWLLTAGGLGVLAGTRIAFSEFSGSAAWQHLPQIASGIAFAAGYAFIGRIRNPLAFPLFLVAAVILVHAFLALSGISIDAARTAGWLLNVSGNAQLVSPIVLMRTLGALDIRTAGQLAGEFVALVTVTVTSLLLGLVVIEVESRLDVDLDRELRLNGLANMLVGAAGGMVGTISVNRTLFNFRSGARGRASGLIAGAVCLAVLGFGTGALVFFPVPVLGGILLHQGTSALREWLIRERRTMPFADYFQVVVIMIAIIGWDFVAGVALGVIIGCLTFAINTSRIRLVKQELDRSSYRSRVDRPMAHQEELHHSGNSIRIMWLHGFVFFGSAHRLLLDMKNMIATAGQGVCRNLILDFRQVLGFDSSAIVSFGKLWNFAEREGFTIALSTLSPPVEKALRLGGLIRPDDSVVKLFPDLDAALEWCEDSLIAERISTEDALRSADEWLMHEVGNPELIVRLVSYLELQEFGAGDNIFEQGSEADALYLLYAGRVSILHTTAEGAELRLRSMIGPTVLGEMGLYRTQSRSATVRADNRCIAYRLSRGALAHMEEDDPILALAFHKFIVRILAARLEFANREIAGLQR